jgi:F-box/leucine-rich repeat protein 10/11
MSIVFCVLPLQRDRKERKHYTDDWALGDEEIEGRRSFRLDDKMESDRFPQCFVKEMVGSGMLMVASSSPLQVKW